MNIYCVLLFGFVAVLQDFFRYYIAWIHIHEIHIKIADMIHQS